MTADRLYHAALRAELTRRLDVRWREVDQRTGAAEIDGLHDRDLLRAFSKRRAQVLAQQQEWGHAGIAAGKAAALATRKPKDHAEPEASFYARVASGLAEHGIGPFSSSSGSQARACSWEGVKLPLALADLGLIDEYEFLVQPILAGHGPTLFAGLSERLELRLVGRQEFRSGAVALRYQPGRVTA